jgi:hypothetical protein
LFLELLEERVVPSGLPVPDDFGDDVAHAHTVVLNSNGSGSIAGRIDYPPNKNTDPSCDCYSPGDVDVFRIVAPVTGGMTIRQEAAPGSSLDSLLTVINGPRNDNSDGTLDSKVLLNVTAGQTLFVQAGTSNGTGDYILSFQTGPLFPDDFGNTPAEAHPVPLSSSGSGFVSGTIETSDDVDMFRFVAPVTGRMAIRQTAAFDSSLDSVLTVFDNTGLNQVTSNDDIAPGTTTSLVVFDVNAGETYFVAAAGFDGSTGGYTLSFSSLADPQTLALDGSGSRSRAGTISRPGQTDLFQFVAPATAGLTIRQVGAAASTLDSFLTVFDSSQDPIAANDDSGGTRDSEVLIRVRAGETFYVQASGFADSTGGYILTVSAALPDSFPAALPPDIPSLLFRRSDTMSGEITYPGEAKFIRLVPQLGHPVAIILQPDVGSRLDGVLTVFDESGQPIAFSGNSPTTSNAVVDLTPIPGRTYYVRAEGSGGSTGTYQLQFAYFVGVNPFDPIPNLPRGAGAFQAGAAKEIVVKSELVLIPSPDLASELIAGGQFTQQLSPLGTGELAPILVATLQGDRTTGAGTDLAGLAAHATLGPLVNMLLPPQKVFLLDPGATDADTQIGNNTPDPAILAMLDQMFQQYLPPVAGLMRFVDGFWQRLGSSRLPLPLPTQEAGPSAAPTPPDRVELPARVSAKETPDSVQDPVLDAHEPKSNWQMIGGLVGGLFATLLLVWSYGGRWRRAAPVLREQGRGVPSRIGPTPTVPQS